MNIPSIHYELLSKHIDIIQKEINETIESNIQSVTDKYGVPEEEIPNRIKVYVTSPSLNDKGEFIDMDNHNPKIVYYDVNLDDKLVLSFSICVDFTCNPM